MSDILRAPINYGVAAGGQFVKGGSVAFGFENIRPDQANPATLKPIFLDDGLTMQAANPQGLSSDATFDQADNGVLFGDTGAKYSIIIYDANDVELSYIPSYDLSDAAASVTAQDAANDASASAVAAALSKVAAGLSEANTLALYTDFLNRYFGAFSSDPALDDEGNPPVDGSLYWNTVNKTFKAYDSGAWYLPQDLGFGTAAYANIQTSPTDTTAGALMAVGAFGLGADSIGYIGSGQDADTYDVSGVYYAGFSNGYQTGSAFLTVEASSGARVKQIWRQANGAAIAERYKDTTWSAWQPVYTGANLNPNVMQASAISDWLTTGVAISATTAKFTYPIFSYTAPVSLTQTSTFGVMNAGGGTKLSGATAALSADSSPTLVVFNITGMTGLVVGEPLTLISNSATSKLTVNF